SNSLFIDRLLVHTRAVEVSDLLIDRVPARPAAGSFLQNSAFDAQIVLVKLGKTLPRRAVGRDFRLLHPVTAGVLVEIHAGIDGLIDGVDVESWSGLIGGRS